MFLRSDVCMNLCSLYNLAKDGPTAQRCKHVVKEVATRYHLTHIPESCYR